VNQIQSASPSHDELSIDVDVVDDMPPRHRPDDTWQALGRAIGEARADEIVRQSERRVLVAPYIAAPPARHLPKNATPARVPESLYPVELPAREPAAMMSAQHPAFQWKETADASLSMQIPVRRPRALRTARLAVAGVTAAAALVCIVAIVTSRMNAAEGGTTAAAAAPVDAPPAAQTVIPEKPADPATVRDLTANMQSTSWTKNVMGSPGDRPGVSVDSLPRADAKPAPRKATKRR
jgi:hypothetical protein